MFPAIRPWKKTEKRKKGEKKTVPLCGNLLTRRAFDFKNTVSVSYISPSQFTAAPWGWTFCAAVGIRERE